jgi:hypothetical protein
MRKYIKTMREQFDNNSVIFKEAKRMFHYDPKEAGSKPYGIPKQYKHKKDNPKQFKDDYSSVKDARNEYN